MGTGVYLESRTALDAFLRPILHDIVAIVEHGRRMTVTVTDVLLALKRNGRCVLPPPPPPRPFATSTCYRCGISSHSGLALRRP